MFPKGSVKVFFNNKQDNIQGMFPKDSVKVAQI